MTMNYRELGKLLDGAVKGIASLNPDQRVFWVAYFFEVLEEEIDENILKEAQTALEERFSAGSW